MKSLTMFLVLLLAAGAVLLAGCSQPRAPSVTPAPTTPVAPAPAAPSSQAAGTVPSSDTVRVVNHPLYGHILVDADGKTLYYYARDTRGLATSACTGTCIANWPAFNPTYLQVSAPVLGSDFDSILRPGGGDQVTYMGWPLYYYAADTAPGETKGHGAGGVWFVMGLTGVKTTAVPTTTP